MKKILALALMLCATPALAQWQVPTNAVPFGRGSGTGFNYAQAAANAVLMTDGSSIPGLGQTLPTAVQNNITRVGTLVAGAIPFTLATGRVTYAQLPAATGASVIARTTGAGDFAEVLCGASGVLRADAGGTVACNTIANSNIAAAAAIAFSKMASLSANQVLGALTATTPSGLSMPSCSTATSGLIWTSGTGFGCNTFPSVSSTATTDRYLKGNGSAWITSTGSASGTGSCGGGQFVTGLNSDAAPTCATPAGGGDVTGPASSTDGNVAVFNGATGKIIKDGGLVATIGFTTGDVKMSYKTTADTGWVMMDDGTIGSAASAGTTRANADTANLYTLLWTNCSNTDCAVSGGRGASAAADFAANKTIALPKIKGRVVGGSGTGSGLTARNLGSVVGGESIALAVGNLPNHTHTTSAGNYSAFQAGATGAAPDAVGGIASTAVNTGNCASCTGTAFSVMQPSTFANFMIKL